jgi:hypothetical protein
MSRAPRPRAFCVPCQTVPLTYADMPVLHGPRRNRCRGCNYKAQKCPTCNNVRTVRQHAEGHVCDTCKGTGRIVR